MSCSEYPQSAFLPQNLRCEHIEDPYLVIHDFFDCSALPDIRRTFWESFKATVTGKFNKVSYKYERVSIVELYERIVKLIEAVYIINEDYNEKRKLRLNGRIGIQNILKYSKKPLEEKILEIIIEAARPTHIFSLCINSETGNVNDPFYDYLVVVPEDSLPFDGLKNLIEEACSEFPSILVSFIKHEQLTKYLVDGHIFYTQVCKEDNNLYKKSDMPLLALQSEQINSFNLVRSACAQFQVEIKKAELFFSGAKFYKQKNENNLALFSLHQATEHTIRALLISITGYSPKHHDLFKLLRYSLRLTTELNIIFPHDSDYERELLAILNKSYRHARYNNNFFINEGNLNVLFDRVSLLQSNILQVFEKQINQYCQLFEQPELHLIEIK